MTIPRTIRRTGIAVATLLTAAALSLAGGPPVQAQPTSGAGTTTTTLPPGTAVHSWALVPGEANGKGERTSFSYELAPGSEVRDVATLLNLSNVPLTFFVYATDAFNNADGSFDLLPFATKPKDVGTWFDLPDGTTITIAPRQQATFPFTIRVPADARPGDHAGAVLASSAALGTDGGGGTVTVDRRVGPRVYVRVAGALDPKLSVERLHTSFGSRLNPFGSTATVTYRIVNRGNVRLGARHRVAVGGPLGILETTSKQRTLAEILPGEHVDVSTTLHGVSATGIALAKVRLEPLPIGEDDDPLDRVTTQGFVFALPIAVLGLVVVAVLGLVARRNYRRRRPSPFAATAPFSGS